MYEGTNHIHLSMLRMCNDVYERNNSQKYNKVYHSLKHATAIKDTLYTLICGCQCSPDRPYKETPSHLAEIAGDSYFCSMSAVDRSCQLTWRYHCHLYMWLSEPGVLYGRQWLNNVGLAWAGHLCTELPSALDPDSANSVSHETGTWFSLFVVCFWLYNRLCMYSCD